MRARPVRPARSAQSAAAALQVEAVLSAMVTAVANRAEAADVLEDLVEQIERESAVAAALEQLVATVRARRRRESCSQNVVCVQVEATAHDPWEAEAAAVRVNADVIVTMHAMVRQVRTRSHSRMVHATGKGIQVA